MKKIKCAGIAVVICSLLSSCGSTFGNKTRIYNVTTPKDITYQTDSNKVDVKKGQTVRITKRTHHDVIFTSKDGENTCSLTDTFSPVVVLNIFTFFYGFFIDAQADAFTSNPTAKQAQEQCSFFSIKLE
ncbi:MAG: hypothetical protein LBC92_05275 [Rickettsiales bacterium]|jgi:hypothetical protein|nr:hypothetical protein [Rickettsiales bacterium]